MLFTSVKSSAQTRPKKKLIAIPYKTKKPRVSLNSSSPPFLSISLSSLSLFRRRRPPPPAHLLLHAPPLRTSSLHVPPPRDEDDDRGVEFGGRGMDFSDLGGRGRSSATGSGGGDGTKAWIRWRRGQIHHRSVDPVAARADPPRRRGSDERKAAAAATLGWTQRAHLGFFFN